MQALTDYINNEYMKTQHDNAGAIHPSSLGDCDRSAVYSYLGLEKDVEHNQFLKRIFFHGHRIERWVNNALREKDILIANSVPLKAEIDGVPVEGELDHIIKWQDGWAIADTKSVSDYAFKYKSFPYAHHALQVGAYQWMLQQMLSKDSDGLSRSPSAWLRYLGKGGHKNSAVALSRTQKGAEGEEYAPVLIYVGRGNLQEKVVSAGDNAMHLALEKIHTLVKYISNEDIPERPWASPNDHPYLCCDCISKGSRKKKDGTRTTPSVYVPSCSYFRACWGVLPVEWSFWSEVSP